jgi:hypothetical protein
MDQNFALSYMYLSKRLKYEKKKFDSNFRSLKQQSADGHFNPLGYTILTRQERFTQMACPEFFKDLVVVRLYKI